MAQLIPWQDSPQPAAPQARLVPWEDQPQPEQLGNRALMPGPWEDYQAKPAAGPWDEYAAVAVQQPKQMPDQWSAAVKDYLPSGIYDYAVEPMTRGAETIYKRAADIFTPDRPGPRPEDEDRSDAAIEAQLRQFDATQRPQSGSPVWDSAVPMPNRIRAFRGQMQQHQDDWDEQKEFTDSRTFPRRLADGTVGAVSFPVRAVTRGQYGLGDLFDDSRTGTKYLQSGEPQTNNFAAGLNQSEADFYRATEPYVKAMADIAGFAQGVPVLAGIDQTMRPFRLMHSRNLAEGRRIENAPMRYRDPDVAQARNERIIEMHGRAEADNAAWDARAATRAPDPVQQRALAAFDEEGIQPFAPALATERTRGFARGLQEVPLLRRPLRRGREGTETAVQTRIGQLAENAGAAATVEDAGGVLQRGLTRHRHSRFEQLPEEYVAELGINPTKPPPNLGNRRNYRVINDPENFSTHGMSEADLKAIARSGGISRTAARTSIDDLSATQVQDVLDAPEYATSFKSRSSALYRQFEDALASPILDRRGRVYDPQYATRNSARLIAQWERAGTLSRKRSALSSGTGAYTDVLASLRNDRSGWVLSRLIALRSELLRDIRQYKPDVTGLNIGELKELFGTVQQDLSAALFAHAARIRRRTRNPNARNYIAPDVADRADTVARRFDQANTYYRETMQRMDNFRNILGAATEEQAISGFARALKADTQNIAALEAVQNVLRPEEMRSILGYAINQLGQKNGAFDLETFNRQWASIAARPRVRAIFDNALDSRFNPGATTRSLDNLAEISGALRRYDDTPSSVRGMAGMAGGATLLHLASPSSLVSIAAAMTAVAGSGRLLTSEMFMNRFVRPRLERAARGQRPFSRVRDALDLAKAAWRERDPEALRLMTEMVQALRTGASQNNRNAAPPEEASMYRDDVDVDDPARPQGMARGARTYENRRPTTLQWHLQSQKQPLNALAALTGSLIAFNDVSALSD